MNIVIKPVQTPSERQLFINFPWQIYKNDPCWVPPILSEKTERLDTQRNPFWRTAELAMWIAYREGKPAGTIAGIIDHHGIEVTKQQVASFGFFECIDDQEIATCLFETVSDWARQKGMPVLRGPFNPSPTDEIGILMEGFDTRPAILEAHTPPYYPELLEKAGLVKINNTLARLVTRAPASSYEDLMPEKVRRVAERARQRPDLVIRPVSMDNWDEEIGLACKIYNAALADLPDFVPFPQAEFARFAASFKPLVDPRLALIAEIKGKAVGFALALPDINEAFQHINGRMDLIGLVKLWWYSRKLTRVSFKILMILPEYQGRGVETVLVEQIGHAIWDMGFKEIDMSLTGDENVKSARMQDHLGFVPYRRYGIYEKGLSNEHSA
jgi:GNAT superfamily N-acetyltransferase